MKKEFHFEILRAIACLMVIAIHVSNIYNRSYPALSQASYWTALAYNAVCRVSVPLFFMISGALLAGRAPDLQKSLKRVGKYAAVTVVWVLFYLAWTAAYLDKPYDFRTLLATPPSAHLWFLYAILAIYLVLPLIQALVGRLTPDLTGWLLGLLLLYTSGDYLLSFTPLELKYGIPLISGGRYFAFFFLGYVLYRARERIGIRTRWLVLLLAAVNVALVGITGLATQLEGDHVERFFEYRNPLFLLTSAAVFLLVCRVDLEKLPWKRAIGHIADNSLGIYLLHAVFLNILDRETNMTALPAVVGIPLYVCLIFLVTDGAVTVCRKIKGVRYFFK